MAKIELATITAPLSDDQPCGPDLDMEFDMDFMNFVAEIDGRIPTAFFSFEPGSLDFAAYYDRIGDILQRTRDIRVLVPLAKLRILQSDLSGFAETLDAIHRLLKERWSDLNPRPAEFLELGMGQLATLDDMPNVILPLQHAALVRSRRAGAITLRKWQVAKGEVNAREGEETTDAETITRELAGADATDLGRSQAALLRARDAVAGIRAVCIGEAGYDQAPVLERLPAALEAAIALIETATGGPAEGEEAESAAAVQGADQAGTRVVRLPTGAVATREQAVEAMHVAARYFALREPSSPVPILLREAQTAASKTFYELVSDLVPETAGSAFVALGNEPWFEVYLSTLDGRNPAPDYQSEAEEGEIAEAAGLGEDGEDAAEDGDEDGDEDGGSTDPDEKAEDPDRDRAEDAGATDGHGTEDAAAPGDEIEAGDPAMDDAHDTTEADPADDTHEPGETDEAEEAAPEATDAGTTSSAGAAAAVAPPAESRDGRKFVANSRPEAVALLQQVLAYYRVAEPSSPVPLLVERAIDMSSKSFIQLLGNVLPDGSLKVKQQD